ncbi:vanadium-dependent haloperoxidase [Aquabacterium sp.]|uniref:vanadium-dependent haloperoxidase n=1 Tax=Aquabacterium sp. TaxID=1872578 RepID=UPI00378364B0
MTPSIRPLAMRLALAATLAAGWHLPAQADAVTDWNARSATLIADSKLGTPPAVRVMALVQTAAHAAASAIDPAAGPSAFAPEAAPGASADAAIAAAHRAVFSRLLPAQQAAIDAAYQAALAAVPEGPARQAGIAVGEKAAARVFALRAADAIGGDDYRPHTGPGAYVPTATPAALPWPQRKPWLLASAAQLRPEGPPALGSERWARDFNEVKALGSRSSSQRTPEQLEVARFWEYSLPAIYHGVLQSVAQQPGRSLAANARLYAAAAQAMDDALVAVFDAKYTYNFWRPVTAIRNGDADGNDATTRDAGWSPLIDTPMHPEYPSAHSILAAAVGEVLKAEVGSEPMPLLATSSPSAKGATRQWRSVDDFVREVGNARVWEGVHYRFSTEVGQAMGRRIGEIAAQRLLPPVP